MGTGSASFLFLSCNDNGGASTKAHGRTLQANRHVQVNRRRCNNEELPTVLPLQIRFRAADCRCGRIRCTCRRTAERAEGGEASLREAPLRKDRRRPDSGLSKLSPPLASPAYTRASHLAQCVAALNMECNPVALLPSRVWSGIAGAMLDRATDALILLHQTSNISATGVVEPSRVALWNYQQAVSLLRSRLESPLKEAFTLPDPSSLEGPLGAVCLLGLFDVLIRDTTRATIECFAHWRGGSALILHHSPAAVESDCGRAAVAIAGCLTFLVPCFQGLPSPFEKHACWREMKPLGEGQVAELNRASDRLYLSLPRLICLVRKWRESGGGKGRMKERAKQLAEKMELSRDHDAEKWVLDRSRSLPTRQTETHPNMAFFIPESLHMANLREMTTAVQYWQTRIMILKLLDTISPGTAGERRAELERLAENILMIYEYAQACGFCATAPVTFALVTAWLALRDRREYRGKPIGELALLVLALAERCWSGAVVGGSVEEMDKVANVVVGGPLEGYLCEVVVWGQPGPEV